MPERQTLGVLDYLVALACMAAMVWMGWYFAKRQRSTDHYYAGNRRIPAWAVLTSPFKWGGDKVILWDLGSPGSGIAPKGE